LIVIVVTPLYLPDGRLPSPRWRRVVWLAAACALTAVFSDAVVASVDVLIRLSGEGTTYNPAIGLAGLIVSLWATLALPGAVIVPTAALVGRFRNTSGLERQQLKWIVFGFGVIVASLLVSFVLRGRLGDDAFFVLAIAICLLPLAIAFAVLRYGLYEIDSLISGTIL